MYQHSKPQLRVIFKVSTVWVQLITVQKILFT